MTSRKRAATTSADFSTPAVSVEKTPLAAEVSSSFTEYASYVIGSRALPDARDGLKPVHRRILFEMNEMGLRPDHAHVKSARVVGSIIGKWHPHGDSAVYEALVRMAQDFSMSVPLVDGHGNFGSLDSGPAAMRYTECRLATPAMSLVSGIHEDTVDMVPNYDGSMQEPSVLPAAYPNLLVNGAEGIAVGMATKMAPHNLGEVIAATRYLLKHPTATVKQLMKHVPGPDFPGGCEVVTGDGAREAYATGKGVVTMRAVASVEPIEGSRGRNQITVSALPYAVGPEKIIEAIKKGIADKKIQFVSDVIDLSEGSLELVIELKTGVNAEAALASLYALTPLETNFAIANLALVDGQPKSLGLVEMLQVWLDFRREVVLRRSEHRRAKAQSRLHLVDGLVRALDAIDLVVKTIRGSKTTSDAKDALMKHRSLKFTEAQASHILEMPLRRLTSLESAALKNEQKELQDTIVDLTDIIENDERLVSVIDGELAEVAKTAPARQSVLLDAVEEVAPLVVGSPDASSASVPADDTEYTWHLTAEGLLTTQPGKKDVVISSATVSGKLLLVCADGVAVRVPASLTDRMKASVAASHASPVVGVCAETVDLVLGTARGVVRVMKAGSLPGRGDEFTIINLEPGDEVLWAGPVIDGADAVFITTDAQLLRFPLSGVRAQGRSSSGVAGMKVKDDQRALAFAAGAPDAFDIYTATDGGKQKVTALTEYPVKGRGTGGVRCHTMTKGSTGLARATVVPAGGMVPDAKGKTVKAPARQKRDGSGE